MSEPIRIEVTLPDWLEGALRHLLHGSPTAPAEKPLPAPASTPAPTPGPPPAPARTRPLFYVKGKMTPERIALAARMWRDEHATLTAVLNAVNALPGAPVASLGAMEQALSVHNIRRGRRPLDTSPPLPALPGEPGTPAPRLPEPGLQNRILATRFQVRTWSAHHLHICYDGSPACLARVNAAARTLPGWDARTEIVQLPDGEA